MAAVIYRGGSCRIKFNIKNVDVANLGEPVIAISQELAYLSPDAVVDTENNCVYADLSESDTIQLVDDAETKCQCAFQKEDGTTYRFPVHNITVSGTLMWTLFEEDETNFEPVLIVNSTDVPNESNWYELVDGEYVLSQDTFPVEGKTYYVEQ